jgi:diguanylate cyclase (GGDEF)-like protein
VRILIADDDRLSALVLEATLKASGHEVTTVMDGLKAWEVLEGENPPRLAILDWMMPGMDGLEVCRKVRLAGGPYIYILLLTANTNSEEAVKGFDAGADDYIRKPFNPEELQARLRSGARILEAEHRLRVQAMHDALTGVLNRPAILESLSAELNRANRQNAPLSLAMVDLDHFKLVNDTHGHQAGDVVLREAALRMRQVLRPYDLIGRYGGEEFLIVFPGCELPAAAAVAERVRAMIAHEPVDTGPVQVPVTASLGVADTRIYKESESLIRAADTALYAAKRAGRNQVKMAE